MDSNDLPTRRLTAPNWLVRLSKNFIVRFILAVAFISVPLTGLNNLFHLFPSGIWYDALWAKFIRLAVSIMVMHGMYILYVRIIERRREREINPKYLVKEALIGAGVGVALIAVIHVILALTGNYHIAEYLGAENLIYFVYLALISGYTEELMFRGVFFRIFEQGLGSWIALIISSIIFGFMHMVNPNATVLSSVFISLEAGLLMAGAYMLTRRLWMSMGIHFAWNFTLGGVWGTPVSGLDHPGMFRGVLTGPELITGGSFGIEASIVTALIATGLGVVFIYMAMQRGHFIPVPWRRPGTSMEAGETDTLATPDELGEGAVNGSMESDVADDKDKKTEE